MRQRWVGRQAAVLSSALVWGACARHHEDVPPAPDAATPLAADGGEGDAASSKPRAPVNNNAHVGAKAMVTLDPRVPADPGANNPLHGSGSFYETADGVDAALGILGCPSVAKEYPLLILQASDCSDASLLGARWDSPRGEGLPPATCGTTSLGRVFYTRAESDAKPWTIGKPDDSNLIGHALAVYDPDSLRPLACGVIERADETPPPTPTQNGAGPSLQARAVIADLCLGKMIVRDNTNPCPNPAELVKCASAHCELDACLATCASYTACLDQTTTPDMDICKSAWTCDIDAACSSCQGRMNQCVFGFCSDVVACAAPVTPNGPCAQLEACCSMQPDDTVKQCLDTVHVIEKLSGDPSCYGVMRDWDTTAHLKVPCMFQ